MNNSHKHRPQNVAAFVTAGHKVTILVLLLTGFLASSTVVSQEADVSLSSSIVGNQEQPKVLYIVPWQPVGNSELENQSIESQLDVVFGHVEQVELRRELLYNEHHAQLVKKTAKKAADKD